MRVDGTVHDLATEIKLDKNLKHNIEIVVDRLVVNSTIKNRLTDSVETALHLAEGLVLIDVINGEELLFSEHFACNDCNFSMEELAPRMFSFNSPYGACPACNGLGTKMEVDPELVVSNPHRSLADGALDVWGEKRDGWYFTQLKSVAEEYGFSLDQPWQELSSKQQEIVLYGSGGKNFFLIMNVAMAK